MDIVLALLALAAPAFVLPARAAQDSEFSTRETRKLMHDYAKCVVDRQGLRASEALLGNVGNSVILRRYPQLVIGNCLPKQTGRSMRMSFSGDLYRYALADALVNKELAGVEAPDFSAVPRLDQRDPGEPPQPLGANGRKLSPKKYEAALSNHSERAAVAFIGKYGECVVRLAPQQARTLLLTAPDSKEESSQLSALGPALGTCLPEGETLRFGRTALRGTIAINYYRLAHAARASAAGKVG